MWSEEGCDAAATEQKENPLGAEGTFDTTVEGKPGHVWRNDVAWSQGTDRPERGSSR